jgi:hypothetical protein
MSTYAWMLVAVGVRSGPMRSEAGEVLLPVGKEMPLPDTVSGSRGKVAEHGPWIVTVPVSGNCPSALGVVDWTRTAVTDALIAGVPEVVKVPVKVPVTGANWTMFMAVEGMEQVPPTIWRLPWVKVCGSSGRVAAIVAVPPEIGMVRVRLLEASSVPVTARSVVMEGQLLVRLEASARNVPVTVLPLDWSAPVKSAMVPDELRCEIISQLPERLLVELDGLGGDEPQARRAASGNRKRKRGPGNMVGMVRRSVG